VVVVVGEMEKFIGSPEPRPMIGPPTTVLVLSNKRYSTASSEDETVIVALWPMQMFGSETVNKLSGHCANETCVNKHKKKPNTSFFIFLDDPLNDNGILDFIVIFDSGQRYDFDPIISYKVSRYMGIDYL
jgi:hypothetical protein